MLVNLSLPFDFYAEDFPYTDAAAGMLSGEVVESSKIISKTISIRIDPNLLGFLDFTVANANGKFSRNALIVNLIRSGAEAAWAKMSKDERKKFFDKLVKQKVEYIGEIFED